MKKTILVFLLTVVTVLVSCKSKVETKEVCLKDLVATDSIKVDTLSIKVDTTAVTSK